ncbi:MAG: hypothetical protein LH606_16640 [Cytophagaceae bacterium]|nr:hypothetical protein [Cytophagaceae bacterium]
MFIVHSAALAQGIGNAPYSALGVGETFSGGFAVNQMMGGSGVAASNGIYINNLNPALLARNRNVTFEVGLLGQLKRLNDGTQRQQTAGGNLNYLTLGLPINRRWTASIGLQPYSYVDYEIRETKPISGSIYYADYTYKGNGGLSRVALNNGFSIGKSLYAGISASYLFGNINRQAISRLRLFDAAQDYQISLQNRVNYHDLTFKGGLAWRQKLREKLFLNLAGTADFGTDIRAEQIRSYEVLDVSDQLIPGTLPDTVNRDTNGSVRLAPTYRVGLSLESPFKFTFNADLAWHRGSKFRSFGNTGNLDEKLRDSYTVSVGAEYTPNILAATGYWKHVPYRLGFSYGKTPYSVNGQQPNEWSVSTGMSLPLSRGGLSDLNLAFTYGQRGAAGGGLIQEQYGRFLMGFTFNDRWFQRLVID